MLQLINLYAFKMHLSHPHNIKLSANALDISAYLYTVLTPLYLRLVHVMKQIYSFVLFS